jgi:Tol biopolymer transport system component
MPILRVAPDGSRILYTLWDNTNPEVGSIGTMTIDGTSHQLLVDFTAPWSPDDNCRPEDAIWSPDGAQIAYRWFCESLNESGEYMVYQELWIMDADGSNQRLVTAEPAFRLVTFGGEAVFFQWMRNGYIYFVNEHGRLYAVNPENGSLHRLMDNVDSVNARLSLSPDGKHARVTDGLSALAIQQAGLIPVEVPEKFVGWSVDGERILYQNNNRIWLHDLKTGKDSLLLSYESGQSIHVQGLSPGSRFLAYQTNEGLFVLDIEENGEPQLVVADAVDPVSGWRTVHFIAWIPVP